MKKTEDTKMMNFTIRKQTQQGTWGIYKNGKLIEGGFFSFGAAQSALADWQNGGQNND